MCRRACGTDPDESDIACPIEADVEPMGNRQARPVTVQLVVVDVHC
jgi:hypothetical protein